MNRFVFLILISISSTFANAQYQVADNGSSVQFKIKNLGFGVSGSFGGLQGKILFDPGKLEDAVFDVSIDANSVNTGIDMRDDHLRKESYFDVTKYPRIRIVSTKITNTGKNNFLFSGKLTIKNQTKDISFPFTVEQVSAGYLFKGSFKVKRKDFGVGGNSTISDELEVSLNVNAKQ
ncbi:MAG: YceI family protein [Bacteroidetes bacterium]|nr:YceI family protein [Bacteroidota bacterium]